MKKFAAIVHALFCLALFSFLIAPAISIPSYSAGGFGVGGNLTGFWQKKISPSGPSLQFIGCTEDSSNLTTYTYTNHSIGPNDPNKTVTVVFFGEDGTADFSTSSATIGGIAAAEQVDTAVAARFSQISIYSLNTSGTTATITVTWSEPILYSIVCVYAAYGLNSSTRTDFAVANSTATLDLDTDIQAGGIAVGGCIIATDDIPSYTWTGLNEDIDVLVAAGDLTYTAASIVSVAAQTPLQISCTSASGTTNVGAVAAFR